MVQIHLNGWELAILFIYALGIVIHTIKHGETRDEQKWNAGIKILSVVINMFILYKAGLFQSLF